MARANPQLLSRMRDLVDADGCVSGSPTEWAEICDALPMEVGKAMRNPVMVRAFEDAGYCVDIGDENGRLIITISRQTP